jgi:hypothetical protein
MREMGGYIQCHDPWTGDTVSPTSFESAVVLQGCATPTDEKFQIELAKASIRMRARSLHSASVKIGRALGSL